MKMVSIHGSTQFQVQPPYLTVDSKYILIYHHYTQTNDTEYIPINQCL